ncbi:MAG: GTPase ObgE [Patescibacteria group bacterium]
MAFIDEITLHISAGKGGDGVVRFRHEKGKDKAGPAGGDGGRGGDVYVSGSRSMHSLVHYRNIKKVAAENGQAGMKNSRHGKGGEDLVLNFPLGTVLKNKETGEEISIEKEGEKILISEGGIGGYGNEHFKSSINRTPREWTPGKPGGEGNFFIELRLFADLGLVGLPNAGKTSFLNVLTNARGVVGAYQFTTLEPNLGDLKGFIVADIPGLIEGASEGKGLGHAFLRHIRRTKMIAHLISLEESKIDVAYKTIRKELKKYDPSLLEKDEIIILTKKDAVDAKTLAAQIKKAKKLNPKVFTLSLYDDASIKEVTGEILLILKNRG